MIEIGVRSSWETLEMKAWRMPLVGLDRGRHFVETFRQPTDFVALLHGNPGFQLSFSHRVGGVGELFEPPGHRLGRQTPKGIATTIAGT